MANAFTQDEEGLLHSIKNWVQNECEDQSKLLLFYNGQPQDKPKALKPPYAPADEALARIALQLESISEDQATVATYYGSAGAVPGSLPPGVSNEDALYSIQLWHIYLSANLKAILDAEAG